MYTTIPTPPTEGVNTHDTEITLRLGALYGSLSGLFILFLLCICLCSREGPCCPNCRKRASHRPLICCKTKKRNAAQRNAAQRNAAQRNATQETQDRALQIELSNVPLRTNDLPPGVHSPYSTSARTKLTPSQVAKFEKIVKKTWMYDRRLGRDSSQLNHKTIIVKEVYKIENVSTWKAYKAQKFVIRMKAERNRNGRLPRVEEINNNEAIRTQNLDLTSVTSNPCDLNVNEVYLFHGTKRTNISGIIKDGFNLNNARDGLYGKGIYLAESAEKADQYTDTVGTRRNEDLAMFLVRTMLGRSYIHDQEQALLQMPCVHKGCMRPGCTDHESFDSILAGTGKRFREFMLFNPEQCFPEFLIIYDRA